jgi:hypothetical protein
MRLIAIMLIAASVGAGDVLDDRNVLRTANL